MSQILPEDIITFVAGTKAKSAEVNSNIQALITGHNNTDQKLTNLKIYNVADYGNDIAATITAAGSNHGYIYHPKGTYTLTTNINYGNNVAWFGSGAILTSATSKTVTFNSTPIYGNAFIGSNITPIWINVSVVNLNMFHQLVADANYYSSGSWYQDAGFTLPSTDNATLIQSAVETITNSMTLQVDSIYYTTSPISLPSNIKGTSWRSCGLVGSTCSYTSKIDGSITGMRFTLLEMASCWSCDVSNIYTDSLFKLGKIGYTSGIALNSIQDVRAEGDGITLDNTYEWINLNTFSRIDAQGTDLKYGLLLTGTGSNDMHSNTFDSCDFAGALGVKNESQINQWNFLESCYIESGADISGKWQISKLQNDSNGSPLKCLPEQIVLASSYINSRTGDHFPLPITAIRPWSNIQGNNPSYLSTNGFPGLMIANSNEPTGLGYYFGGTTSNTNTSIDISLPYFKEGRGVLTGYIYIGNNVSQLLGIDVIIDGTNLTSYNVTNSTYMGDGWYYINLPFTASTNPSGSTVIRAYVNQLEGIEKTIGWGNIIISRGNIGSRPVIDKDVSRLNNSVTIKDYIINSGRTDQSYLGSGTSFTKSFVFSKPYTTLSSIVVSPMIINLTGSFPINDHSNVTNLTVNGFDLVTYYSPDFGGTVGYISTGY